MDIWGCDVVVVVSKAALLAFLVIVSSDDPGGAVRRSQNTNAALQLPQAAWTVAAGQAAATDRSGPQQPDHQRSAES
jgi:hypothetical protein